MITVDTDDSVSDRLAAMGDAVQMSLLRASQELVEQLIDAASALLPDGPLRDSLAASVDPDGTGVTVSLGSDLPYASVIDQGFAGSEQVRQALRLQSVVFGKPMTPREVLVRAHMRQADIPARHFLSGPFDAMQDGARDTYAAAIDEALDE